VIEIHILGQKWRAYIEDDDTYSRRWGESDGAHTIPADKEMYFNEAELSRVVVTHELVHAYYSETCVSSANLTVDQIEEVMAEMFGVHGNKLLTLSRKLYKELRDESGR
jgi:hypothetical protein